MKRIITLILIAIIAISSTNAQKLQIAVQNGNEPAFYNSLPEAIANSNASDTIYLPGGEYPGLTINKEIHLIGVGHRPDETSATGASVFTSSVTFAKGCQKSSVQGILFTDTVHITTSELDFSKNMFKQRVNLGMNNVKSYLSEKINFRFNVFVELKANAAVYPENCFFYNNIIVKVSDAYFYNTLFSNNIFIEPFNRPFGVWGRCIFTNNVMHNLNLISESRLENNIFTGSVDFTEARNEGNNNIENQSLTSLFKNFDGSFSVDEYYSTFDFNLVSTGKNAGADGKDIGIYGGPIPYYDMPRTPHFKTLEVPLEPNAQNKLNIELELISY